MDKKTKISIEYHLSEAIRVIRTIQGPGINKISEVTSHLYLANIETALNRDELRSYGIRVILHLGTAISQAVFNELQQRKVTYINLPIKDSKNRGQDPDLVPYFENCYHILQKNIKAGNKTVIACESGVSISAAILIYFFQKRYYITNYGISKDKTKDLISPDYSVVPEIIRFMKESRPCIEPKPNLIFQILIIEFEVKHALSRELLKEAGAFFSDNPKLLQPDNYPGSTLKHTGDDEIYVDDLSNPELITHYLDHKYRTIKKEEPKPDLHFDQLSDLLDISDS